MPLTPGQETEVRRYINARKHQGEPWNTRELGAMLKDMLMPPADDEDDGSVFGADTGAIGEYVDARRGQDQN